MVQVLIVIPNPLPNRPAAIATATKVLARLLVVPSVSVEYVCVPPLARVVAFVPLATEMSVNAIRT